MKEAIEITTFKLAGYSCADFIAANADVDAWLKRQPGFRSRHVAEREDGTIVDMLLWDTVAHGTDAMQRLMDELADSPVHAMIDQDTVSWSVTPVRHRMMR
ncbi:MAG: hypothetical protein WBD81_24335 [Collimonas pratensis]|uniref:hypothetical protein n=1 Tax=Collimonas pratensis TaxID=279113 RepID=UPI003C72D188